MIGQTIASHSMYGVVSGIWLCNDWRIITAPCVVLCLYEGTFGQLWSSKTRDSENLSSVAFQSQKLDARLRTTAAGLLRAVEHVRRMLACIAVVKIWTRQFGKEISGWVGAVGTTGSDVRPDALLKRRAHLNCIFRWSRQQVNVGRNSTG